MNGQSNRRLSGSVWAAAIGAAFLWPEAGASQTEFRGHGKGTMIRELTLGRPVPLLDGFFFRFGPPLGQRSRADHHLKTIEVAPFRPGALDLTVTYRDRNADDSYAYTTSFHTRTGMGIVSGELDLEDRVCFRVCEQPIERPSPDHVFVLQGFELGVRRTDDAHVQRIGIFEERGSLFLVLESKDGFWGGLFKPPLGGRVQYSFLPAAMVRETGTARGQSKGTDSAEIPAGASVVSGFDLRFRNGHHHVREVGVTTPDDGRVDVFFNDRKPNDPFEWRVDWAVLGRDMGGVDPQ